MNVSMPNGLRSGQGNVTTPPHADAVPTAQQTAVASSPPAADSAGPAPQQPSSEQIQTAVENLRKAVTPVAQNLQFSVDSDTNKTVITVMDSSTKEVIRQIPSEEILALAKGLDKLQGLLIKRQA